MKRLIQTCMFPEEAKSPRLAGSKRATGFRILSANPVKHQVRRPRDLSLCVADIYKAQPALLENSGRHTDPLQPQYQFLGATQVRPVEPYKPRYGGNVPKFSFSVRRSYVVLCLSTAFSVATSICCSNYEEHIYLNARWIALQFVLETRDIEGAAPKRMIPERNYVRHNTDCSDIEYASPNYFSRRVRSHVFPGQRRLPPEPPSISSFGRCRRSSDRIFLRTHDHHPQRL